MKNILKLDYPSSWWGSMWRDALPAGNGYTGAAVCGGVYREKVLLTHADLWWQSHTPEMPDISHMLPEVQKLLMNGQVMTADKLMPGMLKEQGYNPKIASPLPLGDLEIVMENKQAFSNYSRCLNMETGEITVRWLDGMTCCERKLFVSRINNMIVYEILKEGYEPINARVSLNLHDLSCARRPQLMNFDDLQASVGIFAEQDFIFYAARNDDGTDFGAVARIISENGDTSCSSGVVEVNNSNGLLIYIKLFVNGERQKEWVRLKSELLNINEGYNRLLEPHKEEFGRLFNSSVFDLFAKGREKSNEELLLEAYRGHVPAAMAEKMWAYGRYLLISSTQRGGQPCHLYGLWCGDYDGIWAYNMANENLQMIYWQALSGNLPELLLNVFDYYERLMDDFRINAKRLYGCRGIYIPAPTAPDSGLLKHTSPHIMYWTGAAGWIAQHYYDYYLYTEDLEFLKHRALPFMRETALFYEDFFTMGDDGFYVSCPSVSPENTPENYLNCYGNGAAMETTINAALDFAIAKEVLANLIEGSKAVDIFPDEIEKWENMLKRIPPYQINEDGAVKEWMHPYFKDNYHHRHQSHIYPVFPGMEVTREGNPKLFESFETTLKKRLGIGFNDQTGWSLAHMANCYARMGEGEAALECLDIISRSCVISNFNTLHNDWRNMGLGVGHAWAPFQIDANMGWSSAVQEMLLFSCKGIIKILPALPKRWRKGKAGPLMAKGGIEVILDWDQDAGIINAEILSLHGDAVVDIKLPDNIESVRGFDIRDGSINSVALGRLQAARLECKAKVS